HTRDPFGSSEPIAETRAYGQTRTPFRSNIHAVLSVAYCRNTIRVTKSRGLNLRGKLSSCSCDIRGSSECVSGNDLGNRDVGKSGKVWSFGRQSDLRSFHIRLRLCHVADLAMHNQV